MEKENIDYLKMVRQFNEDEGIIRTNLKDKTIIKEYKEKYCDSNTNILDSFYEKKNLFTYDLINFLANKTKEQRIKCGFLDIVGYCNKHDKIDHVCIFTEDGDYFTIICKILTSHPQGSKIIEMSEKINIFSEIPDKSGRISRIYLDTHN